MQEEETVLEEQTGLYVQLGIIVEVGRAILHLHYYRIVAIGVGRELEIDITLGVKSVLHSLNDWTSGHRVGLACCIRGVPCEVEIVVVVGQSLRELCLHTLHFVFGKGQLHLNNLSRHAFVSLRLVADIANVNLIHAVEAVVVVALVLIARGEQQGTHGYIYYIFHNPSVLFFEVIAFLGVQPQEQ